MNTLSNSVVSNLHQWDMPASGILLGLGVGWIGTSGCEHVMEPAGSMRSGNWLKGSASGTCQIRNMKDHM